MATGFVQRFKGKIQAESLFIKGWGFSEVQATTPAAGSTLSQDRANYVLNASSGAIVFTLPPVENGAMAKLIFQSVSSGIFVKASTSPAVNTFGTIGAGGATALVLKSTAQMTVDLIGISSIAWNVVSVWSTYSTAAATAQPVFSTTT